MHYTRSESLILSKIFQEPDGNRQGNERQGNGTSAFQFFIPLPVIPLPYAVSGISEDQRRSAVKEREGWATVLHSAFHGTPIPRLAEVPIRWGERPREP
jgi:hypothetical protein